MIFILISLYLQLISLTLFSSSLSLPALPLTSEAVSSSALDSLLNIFVYIFFVRTLFADIFSAYWLSPLAGWKQRGRCSVKFLPGRCWVGVIGIDCVLLSMEDSGWKDWTGYKMDVAVEEDVDVIIALLFISDCKETGWIGNWVFRMLSFEGWLQGSWSEKRTGQISVPIAANLASIADTKGNRLVFPCRPSAQSFIVFTSQERSTFVMRCLNCFENLKETRFPN